MSRRTSQPDHAGDPLLGDDFDYGAGTDPDSIVLDNDAVAFDPAAPEDLDGDGATAAEPVAMTGRKATWLHVAVAGLAFLVLGFGIGVVGRSLTGGPNAVDVGFTRDMIDHHDQAVYMARIVVMNSSADPSVRRFAEEVITAQRWEIGVMDSLLDRWGRRRGDTDRTVMTWMGMPTSLRAMPGMQPEAKVAALLAAKGRDADRLFLEMMAEHHHGGIHMASYAADRAGDKRVRELAATFARNQAVEIREYAALAARLGVG